MADKKPYYITTANTYTSGKPQYWETLMRLFWLTRSQDTREVRDTMYFSRQELMSMVRRSSSKQKRRE